MKIIIIANLIDWSKAFTSKNGSFYCGTTDEQKQNTVKILNLADLVIENTDLHPLNAPEFRINGGLFPVHNVVLSEQYDADFIYMITPEGKELKLETKTLSPQLTEIIEQSIRERKKALIVPKGVYFQGRNRKPFCNPEDIEKTFKSKIITAEQFVNGDNNYIIAPKQYFDATRLDSDVQLQDTEVLGIPKINYNVYSLIDMKFPRDKYKIVHINTGVVEGICRLHTSTGLRQMFPFDRIINVADATTPLVGIGLGYKTAEESRDACMRVGKDIGIEYKTTREILNEFWSRK